MGSRIESCKHIYKKVLGIKEVPDCTYCGKECRTEGDGRVEKIRGRINTMIIETLVYNHEPIEQCPRRQLAIDHQDNKKNHFRLNARADLDISASGFPTVY